MEDAKRYMVQALEENRRRDYLRFCKENYTTAVSVGQVLFPAYYKQMRQQLDTGDDAWHKYNSKAEQAREAGQTDTELAILAQAVDAGVDTPGTYERLAVLLGKQKEHQKAYEVCRKWFSGDYWKIPNAATTSLRLLERMEKLKTRL
jgi:hypothetical protein